MTITDIAPTAALDQHIMYRLPAFEFWHQLRYVASFCSDDQVRPVLTKVWLYATDDAYWLAASDSYTLGWSVMPRHWPDPVTSYRLPTQEQFVCMIDPGPVLALKFKPTFKAGDSATFDLERHADATWHLTAPETGITLRQYPVGDPPQWQKFIDFATYQRTLPPGSVTPWLNPDKVASIAKAVYTYTKALRVNDSSPISLVPHPQNSNKAVFIFPTASIPLAAVLMPQRQGDHVDRLPWSL